MKYNVNIIGGDNMSKTASVFTRVDPVVKEQAEEILDELGISMSTAMGLFLKQIVLQRGIPFDVKIPTKKPICIDDLSEEEVNLILEESIKSAKSKNCKTLEEFEKSIRKELNL